MGLTRSSLTKPRHRRRRDAACLLVRAPGRAAAHRGVRRLRKAAAHREQTRVNRAYSTREAGEGSGQRCRAEAVQEPAAERPRCSRCRSRHHCRRAPSRRRPPAASSCIQQPAASIHLPPPASSIQHPTASSQQPAAEQQGLLRLLLYLCSSRPRCSQRCCQLQQDIRVALPVAHTVIVTTCSALVTAIQHFCCCQQRLELDCVHHRRELVDQLLRRCRRSSRAPNAPAAAHAATPPACSPPAWRRLLPPWRRDDGWLRGKFPCRRRG